MDRDRYKDREVWLKETSNGMLCVALGKATDKPIMLRKTADGVYTDIIFENMRIHSWFSNFGVNSDNEEPGTPDIVLPLYTWAKCADIRKAAGLLYEEKGIHVVTDNVLSTTEACSLAGLPEFDLIREMEKKGLQLYGESDSLSALLWGKKDNHNLNDDIKEVVDFILEGMNGILHPEFSIHRNTLSNEIYIKANYKSVKDVEEQTPLFKNKIKSIVDFFNYDAAVKEKIHN